jgi:hypothetical protein
MLQIQFVTHLSEETIHIDGLTNDGLILLAAIFDNCILHYFLSNLHFARPLAPVIYEAGAYCFLRQRPGKLEL